MIEARGLVKRYGSAVSQRLGIAAALLGDPAVLIFDEPVNGLDPDGIHWVRTLTRELAAEGRTVMELTRDSVEYQATGATR